MDTPTRALYVQNAGDIATIPIDEHIVQVFSGYTPNVSHGFILEFRYTLELSLDEEEWARSGNFMDKGVLFVPDNPIEDCLAAAYHIFNNMEMGVGVLPVNIAYILAHIYNILTSEFSDSGVKAFMINCDDWVCNGYAQES